MDLAGKTAVIAGATGGLGRVVTSSLAQAGVRLALMGRSEEHLNRLADELGLPAAQYLTAAVDLTQPDSLGPTVRAVKEKLGNANLLLNLVGGWLGGKTLVEVSPDVVEEMLDQHLWTTFRLVRAFLPQMLEHHAGRVIVVSSPTATQPRAKAGPYAIGKAAQEALMMTLAAELKGTGVTANVIQVRSIDTEHQRAADPEKYAGWTTPEEIASAIAYLSSAEGGRVNGARLPLF